MGSRSGVLWDALAGRLRSPRKAAVASLKDQKITAAILTFDENAAFLLTDKSGKLSYGEIADALAEHSKEGMSKEGIASVVAAFDTDGDDELDRQEFEGGLHELLNQKAAGSQADLLEALAALNADVQAVPTKQLSVGKLRTLAGQLGQLKADAERLADVMEAKGAAEKAEADAKPASKAKTAAKADAGILAVMTPTAQAAAEALTVRLLESLAAKEERVALPIRSNAERRRSGRRGMSRALLFGVKAFYAQRGALDKVVQDILDERLFPFSACELTKSTGLSLQETLVLEAGEGEGL